jgi:Mg2+ and Co2+ transporter CorA
MEVDTIEQIETVNKRVMQMVEALMQYRTQITKTAKAVEDNSAEVQRCAKEAAAALTEVSDTAVRRLAKLL